MSTTIPQQQSVPDQADQRVARRACLLVLGMHRSGTSALTRVLNFMGAALPANILGADASNEAGHWEPERLIGLHDQMLAEAGSSWDDWNKLDLAVLPAERLDFYKSQIRTLIEEEYGASKLFVLKEPRICRFVPLYRDILDRLDIDVLPVLMFRHPLEVAASLKKRNETPLALGQLYWLRHIIDAERDSRSMRRAVLSYEELLGEGAAVVKRAFAALQLDMPELSAETETRIGQFASPAMKHMHAAQCDTGSNPALMDWVSRAYGALCILNADPGQATHILDQISQHLEPAIEIFAPILAAERGSRRQSELLLSEKQRQIGEIHAILAQLLEKLEPKS
jgi:hypothetical protein